ncbi:hypothetical protein Ahy_B09g095109 isoform H [Arachis hypogaea]|uniref:USP domain-containing protein n=1 Tax=Arachis hypogaea TaxID=3818 RepID=A0A444XD04_ARAHY|nr:hypothetical protein Ahy_B09g095109 isoform H [Arachis hypogaea]
MNSGPTSLKKLCATCLKEVFICMLLVCFPCTYFFHEYSTSIYMLSFLSENADAVKALFGIELISRIHCQESNEESSETESVYSLKCHISQEVNHLHEGIKQGLKSELEKASPALGRSANYLKESRINALPRYLTVQFVRFFWKRESNQKAKILRKVDYPLELDVYDFCSDDLRKKLEAPRKLLRDEEGKKLGLKGSEKSSVQKDNDEKMADAEGSSNGGGEPSVAPMEEGEKATQMTGIYDLVAVLTHKGRSADSGHYVGWVKQENGKWIEFDDDNPKPRIEDDITRLSGGGELRDFIKEMDKISDLPKIILHDILSRLPYEDAARTSVLSKAWHETWSSFPILVFDGSQGGHMLWMDRKDPLTIQENRRKANSFLKSVDRRLVRFHHHGFAIKEFNLSMMFFHPRFMPHLVDLWMKIVGESSSIQVLKLELELADCYFGCEFDSHAVDNYYYLPPDILKAKSLTELVLSGKIRADKLIVNHRIRFPMLRILSLVYVYLGHEQALEDLISGCPMIEDLVLEHCVGLENVKVHDLPKLKSAKFSGFREIHVDVPSLEYLELGNGKLEFPCDISIDKCRNLKVFILEAVSSVFVSNQWLRELFDKFPFLETLELSGCVTSESLMISSSRLKVLSFQACLELKEAKIDAPNLESCRYYGNSSHMPAAISFVDFDFGFPLESRMDLKRLRAFFQNIAPINVMVSLYLGIMRASSIVFNEDVLQNVQVPLPRIKELRLSVAEKTEEFCVLLINDLFWSFRPAIISLNVRLCSRIFLKLLLEKLRCNNEEERCCSSSQMKCWWHDLKDVKVRSYPEKYENISDCEALLDSMPLNFSFPALRLNFQLEWDSLHTSLSGGGINADEDLDEIGFSDFTKISSVSAILQHTGELRDFIKEMDKISDLPKIILHDILSRLPYEDAARTSVLSKAWHETWSSFPILVFDGSRCVHLHWKDRKDPLKIQDNRRKANSFLKSVDRTLVRFHHHGFAIKEFNLNMMFFHPRFMPHLVDRWMKIVGESSSIQVLKLELELAGCFFGCKFDSHAVDNYYSLPPDVLKAKSLTELVLLGRIRADKLIVNHRIRFPMLRTLSLVNVYLGHEQALEDLISGCPMIEELILEHCVGLEIVKVHDLPKLKSAKFSGFRDIHVDVPSLEYLHLGNDELEFPCDISIDKCRNLKVFLLGAVSSVFVSNQWLLELFDKFPFLERLELSGCITSESLMISSSRLKVLSFDACVELKEARIDAPNLESCRYSGQSSHMPAAMSFVDFDVVFTIEFRIMDLKRLRAFLQNIAPRNVMVSLDLGIMKGSSILFNEDVLQNVEVPLPRIKQLRLSVTEETEELCVLLINDLFWSFRPAIISLNLKVCSRIFLKLLLEKLRCNNKEERCCSSSQMKCWWHDLKDVKVSSSPKKYENLSDCEELLDSLPINLSSPNLHLNFELEWDSLQGAQRFY